MENDKEMQNAECTLSQSERHNEEEVKKITDAKPVSKFAMIISFIILLSYNLFKLIKTGEIATPEEQRSLIMMSLAVLVIFCPIYLSILFDKIFGGKK